MRNDRIRMCNCRILLRVNAIENARSTYNTYPTGCHNVVRLTASNILIVHLPAIKCNTIRIKTYCSY